MSLGSNSANHGLRRTLLALTLAEGLLDIGVVLQSPNHITWMSWGTIAMPAPACIADHWSLQPSHWSTITFACDGKKVCAGASLIGQALLRPRGIASSASPLVLLCLTSDPPLLLHFPSTPTPLHLCFGGLDRLLLSVSVVLLLCFS
jgi:hypothetical protein